MSQVKPTISVVIAGICWGCITIFIKGLAALGLSSLNITALRMIFAAVIYVILLAITKPKVLKIRLKDIWMFVCTGVVSIALFNTLYIYTTVASGQASIAVVLLYTSPFFVVVLSTLIFKEKLTLQKVISLILIITGSVFVAGFIGCSYTLTPLILLSGIASGLFWAAYSIFGRIALKKYDSQTVTIWSVIFGAIGMLPFAITGNLFGEIKAQPTILLWGLGIAVISTVLPYTFYTWGLQRMETARASILAAVEPLVGAIIGMTIYNESHDAIKIVGIVLILAAMVILNLNFSKKQSGTIV